MSDDPLELASPAPRDTDGDISFLTGESGDRPPYVIAEVGVNHNGDLDLAVRSIEAAAECGADAVKFQSFSAAEFMADRELTYSYPTPEGVVTENMFGMFERLELPAPWHGVLQKACRENGVDFLSSAADTQAADLLHSLGVPAIKLSSEDMINYPLLRHVAGLGTPVLLSTGMGDQREVDDAVSLFRSARTPLILLHCVSLYPTPPSEANLLRMRGLAERYRVPVGYSDHTTGITASVVATTLGAKVIEKHFTLDRGLVGPDHELSADPDELRRLVSAIREVHMALGSDAIQPSNGEKDSRVLFRRSVVAAREIEAGESLHRDDLALKRPGTGLHPREMESLIGRKTKKHLNRDARITLDDLL